MRRNGSLGFLCAGLAAALLAGCGATSDVVPTATASAGSGGGAQTARVDQTTLEYFQVAVGDRVYFATDQTDLSGEARAVLDRQAEWLKLNPSAQVRIEGHADERGTREYNLALGARRSEAVTQYLVARGVERARLEPVSFGRERPVETCSRDACWAKNRRAVTVPF